MMSIHTVRFPLLLLTYFSYNKMESKRKNALTQVIAPLRFYNRDERHRQEKWHNSAKKLARRCWMQKKQQSKNVEKQKKSLHLHTLVSCQ